MKTKKIYVSMLIIFSVICILSSSVFADWSEINSGSNALDGKVEIISNALKYVGGACAVIMLAYMGIKFILASPDGQADLKKELPLWIIGCVILFSTSVLTAVKDWSSSVVGQINASDLSGAAKTGGGAILGIFQAIGASAAVIVMVYIGIKYMLESPDGKAILKKRVPTYMIGAIILFAAPQIAGMVIDFAINF